MGDWGHEGSAGVIKVRALKKFPEKLTDKSESGYFGARNVEKVLGGASGRLGHEGSAGVAN